VGDIGDEVGEVVGEVVGELVVGVGVGVGGGERLPPRAALILANWAAPTLFANTWLPLPANPSSSAKLRVLPATFPAKIPSPRKVPRATPPFSFVAALSAPKTAWKTGPAAANWPPEIVPTSSISEPVFVAKATEVLPKPCAAPWALLAAAGCREAEGAAFAEPWPEPRLPNRVLPLTPNWA